jgi:hypothetical protein
MSTSNAIENLVERFVEDLVGFLREEEGDRRAQALAIVTSMLGRASQQASAPPPPAPLRSAPKPNRSAAIWSRQRRQPSAVEPVRETTTENVVKEAPEPTVRPRMRHPRMIVVPAGQSAATYKPPTPAPPIVDTAAIESSTEPASQRRLVQGAAEREALMLESVRTLVRATAGEIAQHGGLPSGTAYVVLKQLIANGRVAKIETSRGMEYSLVSTGAVRPFKRSRGVEAEATTEQAPAATGEA